MARHVIAGAALDSDPVWEFSLELATSLYGAPSPQPNSPRTDTQSATFLALADCFLYRWAIDVDNHYTLEDLANGLETASDGLAAALAFMLAASIAEKLVKSASREEDLATDVDGDRYMAVRNLIDSGLMLAPLALARLWLSAEDAAEVTSRVTEELDRI